MANLNKVMLIGRLTRDPEVRTFSTGGKVAAFGFAVNNRRKNNSTGEWEDEPVFLDIEAFNRGESGKLADRVEQTLHKGQQVYLEGHLKLDQWTSQDGQKRSKLKIVLDNLQYLEPRSEGAGGEGGGRSYRGPSKAAGASSNAPRYDDQGSEHEHLEPPAPASGDEDIPF